MIWHWQKRSTASTFIMETLIHLCKILAYGFASHRISRYILPTSFWLQNPPSTPLPSEKLNCLSTEDVLRAKFLSSNTSGQCYYHNIIQQAF